jgi:hypothetical protein
MGMCWLLTPGITPFFPQQQKRYGDIPVRIEKKYEARDAHGPGQEVHLMADPAAVGG